MTFPLWLAALVDRWREWRDRRTRTGLNIPQELEELGQREAYARVRQELKDRRGHW